MGMDVYGKNEGAYFRASVWSWPSVLAATRAAIERCGLEIDTTHWDVNDGRGCDDPEACRVIADSIEMTFAGRRDDDLVEVLPAESGPLGRMAMGLLNDLSSMGGGSTVTPGEPMFTVRVDMLREWCAFLRACGGFSIW